MSKVRVLYVINKMDRGGAETLLMNIFRNIDKSKFEISFLVHDKNKADYDDEIKELGGKIYYVKPYKIYNYFSYKKEVNNFFEEHKDDFDVVHGHNRSCMSIYLSAAKKQGMYTVAHSHSNDSKGFSSFLYKLLIWRIKYIADFFIGCSKEALYNSYKVTEENDNGLVLKNGIDAKKYLFDEKIRNKVRKELKVQDDFVIGHVGRFVPVKNHKFIVDVFEKYQSINSNSKLVLVGRGPLEDEIKEYVNNKGLSEKVMFLGVRSDVNELLMGMDLLLFPSIYEGLPVTLVEAQCTGLPCLISNNISTDAEITDIVIKKDINDSVDEWVKLIHENTNDRKKYNKDIIENGFDIVDSVKCLEQIYINHSK